MDTLGLIKTLRKLQAYLSGLLPRTRLGRWVERIGERVRVSPRVAALRRFCEARRVYQAGQILARRFVWRDIRGDRASFEEMPAGVAPLLRGVLIFVAAALAAVLVARAWPWPSVDAAGAGLEVARLPVLSLLVAASGLVAGWGALLAGAARANFWALVAAAAVGFVSLVSIGQAAPLRATAPLLPLALLYLLRASSPAVVGSPAKRVALGLGTGFLLGAALTHGVGLSRLPLPAVLALVAGGAAALLVRAVRVRGGLAPLARTGGILLLAAVARFLVFLPSALGGAPLGATGAVDLALQATVMAATVELVLVQAGRGAEVPLSRVGLVTTLLVGLYALAALVQVEPRAAIAALDLALSSFDLSLWVVWYFLGVGIAFKLLKETRAISEALDLLLPGRWLAAAGTLALAALLLLGFGEEIALTAARAFSSEPRLLLELYRLWLRIHRHLVWSETLLVFRWVLLAGTSALLYLWARRLLDRSRALKALYLLLLSLAVVYEYHFEMFAYRRQAPSGTRLFAPVLFGFGVLWLCYTVGMRLASGESPRFSRAGRTGLFGGAFVLCATFLHLKGVAAPTGLADRIFLQMSLGTLHVGLPYFLWVYLGRRYKGSPLPTARLFGAFVLGMLAQLPILLLGKLALGGFTAPGLARVVSTLSASLSAGRGVPASLGAPSGAAYILGAVLLGSLLRLGAIALVRATPLSVVAVYTGFGAAAVVPLYLPLVPWTALAAVFPVPERLFVTVDLSTHHALSLGLAMIVALGLKTAGRLGLLVAAALAAVLEAAVLFATHDRLDDLVSTGTDGLLLAALAGLGALLFFALEKRLAPDLEPAPEPAPEAGPPAAPEVAPSPLLPRRHLLVLASLVGVLLAGTAATRAYRGRLLEVSLGGARFGVPATWAPRPGPTTATMRAWNHPHVLGNAVLIAATDPLAPGGSPARSLAASDAALAAHVRDFRVLSSHVIDGKLHRELSFEVPSPSGPVPKRVAQVVAAMRGRILSLTIVAPLGAHVELAADLRRVARSLVLPGSLVPLE
jgi:hypothetical protein